MQINKENFSLTKYKSHCCVLETVAQLFDHAKYSIESHVYLLLAGGQILCPM